MTVRSRPLCPHPQAAAYSGAGSIDDAGELRLPMIAAADALARLRAGNTR